MRARAVLAALGLLVAAGTIAAGYDEGLAAYERGDLSEALREWLPIARQGDLDLQYNVARIYARDSELRDDAEAVSWYLRAANRGHAKSQNNLGLMYEKGRGVERDDEQAADWYRRAVAGGLAVAMSNLARLYDEGRGVPRDPDQALRLYREAAKRRVLEAQYQLGRMLAEGDGIEADLRGAEKWLRKAAKRGHPEAEATLRTLRIEGRSVPTDRTQEEEDDGDAVEAATIASGAATGAEDAPPEIEPVGSDTISELIGQAEGGDVEAKYELGRRYAAGRGVVLNLAESARWYLEAAEAGHPTACYTVGFLYYRGRGVDRDLLEAYTWLGLAAERGVGDAGRWRTKIAPKLTDEELAQAEARIADLRSAD